MVAAAPSAPAPTSPVGQLVLRGLPAESLTPTLDRVEKIINAEERVLHQANLNLQGRNLQRHSENPRFATPLSHGTIPLSTLQGSAPPLADMGGNDRWDMLLANGYSLSQLFKECTLEAQKHHKNGNKNQHGRCDGGCGNIHMTESKKC